jgi:outer membrane protein OmpA-like peptidoglycan-associated protein
MQTPPMPSHPPSTLVPRRRLLQAAPALAVMVGMASALGGCASEPAIPAAEAFRWTEAQKQGLRALGFEPSGEEWTRSLASSLLFDFDSDRLQPAQLAQLIRLGADLRRLEVPRLRVEGHTDAQGDAAYNQRLSLRRAHAVGQSLQSAGWDAAQLRMTGFGPDKPIADNLTEAGRAQNRRVVLVAMAV